MTIALTPAASCALQAGGAVAIARVSPRRVVTYEFDTGASGQPNLGLRYVVAINGTVGPAFDDGPKVLDRSRTIKVLAEPGSRVSLYLNSDVHPRHRLSPVYPVMVGERDVVIKVREKRGRHAHVRAEVGPPTVRTQGRPGQVVDTYVAALTGDIWMAISHRYTEAEADEILPADLSRPVRDAVLSIYRILESHELTIQSAGRESASALRVEFARSMDEKTRRDTTNCPLFSDILPRTHPLAFAVLFNEAREAGVTMMRVTSAWRPMFGSIAHRAGMGLDIDYIESSSQRIRLNRADLLGNAPNSGNVSETERQLFAEYRQLRDKPVYRPTGLEPRVPPKPTREQDERALEAFNRWNQERDKNEPAVMRSLRKNLSKHGAVGEEFDPWFLDKNTADNIAPVPNTQNDQTARSHNNHLHITIKEQWIL